VKFVETNPLSDPETAARELIEIANRAEALLSREILVLLLMCSESEGVDPPKMQPGLRMTERDT
jgi:hypothetical protein